jgi:hypothetical protein
MSRLRKFPWRAQRVEAPPSTRLFFLRGHPRSGTNWVGALLNLHPDINCVGEFHFEELRRATDSLRGQSWHIVGQEPAATQLELGLQDTVRRCMMAFRDKKPAATWIGDRTPRPLRPLIPGAPYIVIVRDGRDVLVSWTYHVLRQKPDVVSAVVPPRFRERFAKAASDFQADPKCFQREPRTLLADEEWVLHAARTWGDWVVRDRHAADLFRTGELDGSVHVVKYEELHVDTDTERRKMYAFLGLDPSQATPLSAQNRTTAGFGREDSTSFFRHGEVGDWKTYATAPMRRAFKEAAGPALVELGYEKDLNW